MTTMTATTKQDHPTYRELSTPSRSGSTLESEDTNRTSRLQIRRQDIEFRDVAPDRIEITIKVTNAGMRSSPAERAVIQAAPLGAFVPWQPITSLPVPPLEPGQSTILQTEAQRSVPRPLGDLGRLPPSRLLTAMGFDEDRSRLTESPWRQRLFQRVHSFPRLFDGPRKTSSELNPELPTVPANPLDLLARGNVYWAGNLNVFIGDQAVERHRASELRIQPERTNIVMFFVGDGRPDRYRFDLTGLDRRWETTIIRPTLDVPFSRTLSEGHTIKAGSWVPIHQARLLIMALRPPAQCRQAEIEVHVCQESTQQSAVVEFTFDVRAAGSGCYVVG